MCGERLFPVQFVTRQGEAQRIAKIAISGNHDDHHTVVFQQARLSRHLLLSLPLHAAYAQDANAVAERLKQALSPQGMDLAWTGVNWRRIQPSCSKA